MDLGSMPLATTAITVSEIIFGIERLSGGQRKTGLLKRFESLTSANGGLPILGFDDQAAHIYGRFRVQRVRAGLHAHPSDMMIAAITRCQDARIATRNEKGFVGLPFRFPIRGLNGENPCLNQNHNLTQYTEYVEFKAKIQDN